MKYDIQTHRWDQPHGESMSGSLENQSNSSSTELKSVSCYADKNLISFLFPSQNPHKSQKICVELSKRTVDKNP